MNKVGRTITRLASRLTVREPAVHGVNSLWNLKEQVMTEDAFVNHVPVNTGGRGKDELRVFYRDNFIPSWPEDLQMIPVNRVVGSGQLVDELPVTFTHRKPMNWFVPIVPTTNKRVEIDIVVVAQFRGDKLTCERIYWDQATVLRQVGLLPK